MRIISHLPIGNTVSAIVECVDAHFIMKIIGMNDSVLFEHWHACLIY